MFDPKDCDHVSMKEAQEREKANPLTEIARATSIAFVLMAEAGQIDDVTATENAGTIRSDTTRARSGATPWTATCTASTKARATLHSKGGTLL